MNTLFEKHVINIASGVMGILGIFCFILTLIVTHPFSNIEVSTLRTIYMSAALILIIGAVYTKFIHVEDTSETF